MSRKEDRQSDSKRYRSSPKRPRRDGKPDSERSDRSLIVEFLEPSDSKTNGHHGVAPSSHPTEHNERNRAGQVSRSFARRDPTDRGWWRESRNEQREGEKSKTVTSNTQQQRNEKYNDLSGVETERKNNNSSWRRNDGIESDPKPTTRKRPWFREKKLPVDQLPTVEKAATSPKTDVPPMKLAGERREERERHDSRHSGRPFVNGSGRQGFRRTGGRVEKWKHDLFNEANRSPTPKNEEDQIAKVEALLSS